MEREKFINEILNSVDGIGKVNPNDALLQKIENRINESTISSKTLWLVAASIAVLISLNILFVTSFKQNNETAKNELFVMKNNQLYN